MVRFSRWLTLPAGFGGGQSRLRVAGPAVRLPAGARRSAVGLLRFVFAASPFCRLSGRRLVQHAAARAVFSSGSAVRPHVVLSSAVAAAHQHRPQGGGGGGGDRQLVARAAGHGAGPLRGVAVCFAAVRAVERRGGVCPVGSERFPPLCGPRPRAGLPRLFGGHHMVDVAGVRGEPPRCRGRCRARRTARPPGGRSQPGLPGVSDSGVCGRRPASAKTAVSATTGHCTSSAGNQRSQSRASVSPRMPPGSDSAAAALLAVAAVIAALLFAVRLPVLSSRLSVALPAGVLARVNRRLPRPGT